MSATELNRIERRWGIRCLLTGPYSEGEAPFLALRNLDPGFRSSMPDVLDAGLPQVLTFSTRAQARAAARRIRSAGFRTARAVQVRVRFEVLS